MSEHLSPGVYLEEVPFGVRAITGVTTSVTAFVGFTQRGPVDSPTTVTSWPDFERMFGGLWSQSTLGYAVHHFFLNGGMQAVIVRATHEEGPGEHASPATLQLGTGDSRLDLEAASPGTWGRGLRVRVDHETAEASAGLFDLTVRDTVTGATEVHRNLSADGTQPRWAPDVLKGSSLVRIVVPSSGNINRPAAHPAPSPAAGPDAFADPAASSAFAAASGTDGVHREGDLIAEGRGINALERADIFNLLCIPPLTRAGELEPSTLQVASQLCAEHRALLIVDPPIDWNAVGDVTDATRGVASLSGLTRRNAAVYFPRVRMADPLRDGRLDDFPPCGAVAGRIAATDAQRGVWKAPSGQGATLVGVQALAVPLSDREQGLLNALGVNCLRVLPAAGPVIWGARTLDGNDLFASEWKYVPVRRMALFLEESLYRGTAWAVFEPNDEPLWSQLRLDVGAFMHSLFRQGAFEGRSAREAYFVKCDGETTTADDRNRGIVNVLVGFAPLKPAEFVVLRISQKSAQPECERPAMARSAVGARRFDPYKNFKFRVKWDGRYVAGVSKVSALERGTEVVEHREGREPSASRKSPVRTKYEALTLERGVTHDPAFEAWAGKVWASGGGAGAGTSLEDSRKNLLLDVFDETGQKVVSYRLYRCSVAKYQPIPDLDAHAGGVSIEELKLELEGWERDTSGTEPPDLERLREELV